MGLLGPCSVLKFNCLVKQTHDQCLLVLNNKKSKKKVKHWLGTETALIFFKIFMVILRNVTRISKDFT